MCSVPSIIDPLKRKVLVEGGSMWKGMEISLSLCDGEGFVIEKVAVLIAVGYQQLHKAIG